MVLWDPRIPCHVGGDHWVLCYGHWMTGAENSQNRYHEEDEVRPPVSIINQLQTYLRAWEIRQATRKKISKLQCKYTT